VPGLANLSDAKGILERVYLDHFKVSGRSMSFPVPRHVRQGGHSRIPVFYDTVRTLGQTVEVDYHLPGCPPPVPSS
jgi:F420-non-reducing hydrogenase small subunit